MHCPKRCPQDRCLSESVYKFSRKYLTATATAIALVSGNIGSFATLSDNYTEAKQQSLYVTQSSVLKQ
jgi:hypothetical protein